MGRAAGQTPRPPPMHFGDLTFVRWWGRTDRGDRLARWRCTCGVVRTFPVKHVRGGRTRSCGCKMRGRGERPWEKPAGAGSRLPGDGGKPLRYPKGDLVLFSITLPGGRPEPLARGQDRRELARRALDRLTNPAPSTTGTPAYGICTVQDLRGMLADASETLT